MNDFTQKFTAQITPSLASFLSKSSIATRQITIF